MNLFGGKSDLNTLLSANKQILVRLRAFEKSEEIIKEAMSIEGLFVAVNKEIEERKAENESLSEKTKELQDKNKKANTKLQKDIEDANKKIEAKVRECINKLNDIQIDFDTDKAAMEDQHNRFISDLNAKRAECVKEFDEVEKKLISTNKQYDKLVKKLVG